MNSKKSLGTLKREIDKYQNLIDQNIFLINKILEKHFGKIMGNNFDLYVTYLSGDGYHINYGDQRCTSSIMFNDFITCLENQIKKNGTDYECQSLEEFNETFLSFCNTF